MGDEVRERLSRYGTRFRDSLRKADARAAEQEERARDPLLREIDAFEHVESVRAALAKALGKQLNRISLANARKPPATDAGGWYEATGRATIPPTVYAAMVNYDMASDWYEVRITAGVMGARPAPHPRAYAISEETLATNTANLALFNTWIEAVSHRIMALMTTSSDMERDAIEELEAFGVHSWTAAPQVGVVTPAEEQAAIESILRGADAD